MRYSEIDLQCEDIMWFGVDMNGFIFECTSGGCGSVPEFVCCSQENTNYLIDFFMDELKTSTVGELLISSSGAPIAEDSKLLSEKGVFCFDVAVGEGKSDEYKKIAFPINPISITALPSKIQKILCNHLVDIDVTHSDYIKFKHAY